LAFESSSVKSRGLLAEFAGLENSPATVQTARP
jgi:hypothetical protein